MADRSHGESVRVTGEQRLHPALRTLGRACIALVRWQRDQQHKLAEPATDETAVAPGTGEQPGSATETPGGLGQERGHD